MLFKLIFFLYLYGVYFFKKLYRKKSKENTDNAVIIFYALLLFNIHSLILFIELNTSFELGLRQFWLKSSGTPKSSYGYLFGILFFLIFGGINRYLNKKIKQKPKRKLARKAIKASPAKLVTWIYILLTVSLFIYLLVRMAIQNRMEFG